MVRLRGGWARPPEIEGMGEDVQYEIFYLEHLADYMRGIFSLSRIYFSFWDQSELSD